jgi:hypothetical protein
VLLARFRVLTNSYYSHKRTIVVWLSKRLSSDP